MRLKHLSAALASLLIALSAGASAADKPSAIIDAAQLAAAQAQGAIIWDTRSPAAYKQGHIPGAVNIGEVSSVLRDENSEDYLPLPVIEQRLGAAGIDPQKDIIVYGAKANPSVYFAQLTLRYFGARSPRVFHGGIEDWKAEKRAVSVEPSTLPGVALKLTTRPELMVSTAEVLQQVGNAQTQILDVRSPAEYRGEDIRAIRGGHIPGAVSINYVQNQADPEAAGKIAKKLVDNTDGLNLKPRSALHALYSKLDPEKDTIVYCQSGVRAAETATILNELGFTKVRVYDSSWLAYGNKLDAPAENAGFFNVGALQGKLAAMQARIEMLEKGAADRAAR
ncbi:MAG TPA: rhodanese-like domain-containing protein [Burkholderiaceae bacterium]